MNEIENKEITLVVKEKTIGSLVTNAMEIQDWVKVRLEEYSVDNYTGNIDDAKKARAELNNAVKKLDAERIALEKEFMKPFDDFKAVVKQTTSLINTASSKLDRIIKEKESEEKELRRYDIQKLWESKCDFVKFELVLNPRWLNKTAKIDDISCQMKNIIHQINLNLLTIEDFGDTEEVEFSKSYYLDTLDFTRTMKMHEMRIKAKEERTKKEYKTVENIPEEPKKEDKKDTSVLPVNDTNYCLNIVGMTENVDKVKKIIDNLNITELAGITIQVTAEQVDKLKKQMADMEIPYTKCNFLTLKV